MSAMNGMQSIELSQCVPQDGMEMIACKWRSPCRRSIGFSSENESSGLWVVYSPFPDLQEIRIKSRGSYMMWESQFGMIRIIN